MRGEKEEKERKKNRKRHGPVKDEPPKQNIPKWKMESKEIELYTGIPIERKSSFLLSPREGCEQRLAKVRMQPRKVGKVGNIYERIVRMLLRDRSL